jgi:hypothetical protein
MFVSPVRDEMFIDYVSNITVSSVRSDMYYISLLTELDLIFNPRAINITRLRR